MGEPQDAPAGASILNALRAGSAIIVATSLAAAAAPDALGVAYAVVCGALFAVGVVTFLAAFGRGIARSRVEAVTLSGLFFLAGPSAPVAVRRRCRFELAMQVVVVVAAAAIRPYTEVAFGVLAPMYALGLTARWGATHGQFEARS